MLSYLNAFFFSNFEHQNTPDFYIFITFKRRQTSLQPKFDFGVSTNSLIPRMTTTQENPVKQ